MHGYEIPPDATVVGPDDEGADAIWFGREPANGRHALLVGDINDGGVVYAGTLDELEAFTARLAEQVRQVRDNQMSPQAQWTEPGTITDTADRLRPGDYIQAPDGRWMRGA